MAALGSTTHAGNRAQRSRQAVRRHHRGGRARPRGAARASASACSARTAPASRRRCGCSPGRRSPTRVDLRVLGHELPARGQGGAGRDGRRAAARQPRRRRDGGGQPGGVRAPVPGRSDVRAAVDRGLELARLTDRRTRRGGPALGRDAPPSAARARPGARAAADAPGRADRRPRPADPHRAVVADRRAARRGHDDPDVHPLHRGGASGSPTRWP